MVNGKHQGLLAVFVDVTRDAAAGDPAQGLRRQRVARAAHADHRGALRRRHLAPDAGRGSGGVRTLRRHHRPKRPAPRLAGRGPARSVSHRIQGLPSRVEAGAAAHRRRPGADAAARAHRGEEAGGRQRDHRGASAGARGPARGRAGVHQPARQRREVLPRPARASTCGRSRRSAGCASRSPTPVRASSRATSPAFSNASTVSTAAARATWAGPGWAFRSSSTSSRRWAARSASRARPAAAAPSGSRCPPCRRRCDVHRFQDLPYAEVDTFGICPMAPVEKVANLPPLLKKSRTGNCHRFVTSSFLVRGKVPIPAGQCRQPNERCEG